MSRKVQLRLLVSQEMSAKKEDDLIRFPKRARRHFGFANDLVVLGKGKYQINLQVKRAYKSDICQLANMIRQGKLSDEEASSVGFVSSTIQGRVTKKPGNIWISDGIGSITVGADPEFGLIDNDGLLKRGSLVVPANGRFGSDGPGVEVRPPPDVDHLVVVKRIGNILKNPPAPADQYKWIGGATYRDAARVYWFGGHIHLGRPSQIQANVALSIYQRIATALDALLALPMCRFDTPEPFLRRDGCHPHHYGRAGDIRADYPEQDRFEYRVLSGLWLVHPTLAKIAMGAAKCVAETAYGRIADQKFDFDWASAAASRKGLLRTFGLKNLGKVRAIINKARPEEVTQDHLESWKKQIRNLDLFDEYSAEWNALEALSASPHDFLTGLDLDIRSNWYNPETPLLPNASKSVRKALEAVEEK